MSRKRNKKRRSGTAGVHRSATVGKTVPVEEKASAGPIQGEEPAQDLAAPEPEALNEERQEPGEAKAPELSYDLPAESHTVPEQNESEDAAEPIEEPVDPVVSEQNVPEDPRDNSENEEPSLELPPEPPQEKKLKKQNRTKKKRKHVGFFTFVGFTLVFAFASAAFVFLLFNFSGSTLFNSPDDVELPNFFGMKLDDVKSDPQYSRFNFIVDEQFSTDYPEGVIFAQSPKAPKDVKENATITLRVSKGIQHVEVPSVKGLTSDEAKERLEEAGLSVVVRYLLEEDVEDGYAIRTSPEEGETELGGNTVTLYVSREDSYVRVSVPNCVGKTESQARRLLQSAGFSVAVVEKESQKTSGTVIAQAPNDTAVLGTTITITVSKGGLTMNGGDHTHVLVATRTIPPTTNGYGYTEYTCEICGLTTLGDQVPPTG